MRIAFFSDSYYPYVSGVVRSIDLFSRDLRKLGHEVFIFAPDYPDCHDEPNIYRFSSVPAPSVPGYRIPIPYRPQVTDRIRELNLDVIHAHSPFLMGRLASAMSRKMALPLVFTYHTKYEEYVHYVPFARKTARRLTIKLVQDFCRRCNLVVTPTTFVLDMLVQEGIHTPKAVIPTGVDLEKYEEGNPQTIFHRHGLQEGDTVLLYVGRLGKEKNLLLLLETFREVAVGKENIYLILVGGGPDQQEFEELVRDWGMEEKILFTGVVSPQEVVDYYLGAHMFMFPSVTETQGLVVLEAMAAGLPVVAMDREGPSHVIEHGVDGLLVEPDKNSFVEAVNGLLHDDTLRCSMAKQAREKAEAYSSMAMARRLEASYEHLRKIPPPRRGKKWSQV